MSIEEQGRTFHVIAIDLDVAMMPYIEIDPPTICNRWQTLLNPWRYTGIISVPSEPGGRATMTSDGALA